MTYRWIAHPRPFPPATLGTMALVIASVVPPAAGQSTQVGPHAPRGQIVQNGFHVATISVPAGAIWQINRAIDVTFTKDVDFATVSANTISIVAEDGAPAAGVFSLADPRTVRFQPTCPSLEDFSDAGLTPGGVGYLLEVAGALAGGPSVHSTAGDVLQESTLVPFETPDSMDPGVLFFDTLPGPPRPRVRGLSGVPLDAEDATYVELGDDPLDRVYFLWDASLQMGVLELPGFEVPINHYSRLANRVAVVIVMDQAVSMAAANLAPDRVSLEWLPGVGASWERVGTRVELEANCTATGARLRLTPLGILPQASELRVNVHQGFEDITGDPTLIDALDFAHMETRTSFDPGTSTPGDDGDELLEAFLVGGDGEGSFEDTTSDLRAPAAHWGNGRLQAAFDFAGTGGPGGNFDWHIPPGTSLILDTTFDTIVGGPGGVPTTTQNVVNGVVDVRDLFIPASSALIIIGPNPCTILASGRVEIRGLVAVRGGSNPGVGTLNTTNQPEPGALGQGGGGRGGTASFLTTESTPRGGHGFGAFQVPDGGGQGGETSYHPTDKDARRGAGGGGGRLGPDVFYDFLGNILRSQTLIGMDAEPGFAGGPGGLGAISQSQRAMGGAVGAGPFVDGDPSNDFYGTIVANPGTPDARRIEGELGSVWAGEGGGAGGDAVRSNSFPLTPFTITGDEKGAGGGGGGGGLSILALGEIRIVNDGATAFGRIVADGGHGGGGENVLFFDRVGGGSGGGSGGHIVLASAMFIEIGGMGENAGHWYSDDPALLDHGDRVLSALGGQGGAGHDNRGGGNQAGSTQWRCDAIPFAAFEGIAGVPPSTNICFTLLPDFTDPLGPVVGAGGDGGPGLIQLHVSDPASDLRFPDVAAIPGAGTVYGVDLDVSRAVVPPPVGWHDPASPADALVPFFDAASAARSDWIALGLARVNPGGPDDVQQFLFGGTDPAGDVAHAGPDVTQLPPILGPTAVLSMPNRPFITPDGTTMVFDAAGLADDIYERNANLLRLYTVRLFEGGNESNEVLHAVAAAEYRVFGDELVVTVSRDNGLLSDFMPPGPVHVALVPRFFQVTTNGAVDTIPANTSIQILWDATRAGPDGEPDPSAAFGFTPDIQALNAQSWDFYRFNVFFDLDVAGTGIDLLTPLPALDFLRGPFRF
ncbi:MAG: hypothetical protein E2O39_03215 [Planctomycetota bacterium]|nr:MAG: hypothetical protein E2O39_03215 [Planctomycetota bacterium]